MPENDIQTQNNNSAEQPVQDTAFPSQIGHIDSMRLEYIELQTDLKVDPNLEVDIGLDRDYDPDEPVSKSGIQYTQKTSLYDRMGTVKIGKLILEFAIPSIIGMVINGTYNIITAIFLGLKLGEIGLATATVAMPLMMMGMAVSVLVGMGGNALAALKLGAGKTEAAEKVLGNTFMLTIFLAIVCTVLTNIFMDPVLAFSGSTDEVQPFAHLFMTIISYGFILQFLGFGFNSFIRTAGDPNRALWTMVVGIVVDIALNFLFVVVLEFGIAGAAWAAILGQGVTAVTVLHYFTISNHAPFKLHKRHLKPSLRLLLNICVLGSAGFFLQVSAVVLNLVLNNQLVLYGALDPIGAKGALAAIGVVQRIALFAFFPIMGLSMAVQPILGYNYGAKMINRVKQTFKLTFLWMAIIGVFFWLLVHIFPEPIVAIFGVEAELYQFTSKAIQVQMFFMPLVGLQVLVSNYFQSTGQPLKSIFVSLTRQLLFLIPLFYILPLTLQNFVPHVTQLESLYYAYPGADLLSIVVSGLMLIFEWRRLSRIPQSLPDASQALPA